MIRKYLIAGILVWVPLFVTLLAIRFMVSFFDKALDLLPKAYRPAEMFGVHIPGLGLIFTLIVVFVTGVLVTNFLGHKLVHWWELLVNRIPLVRSIYSAVKQVLHTVFAAQGEAFRKVLLIEYPRKGLWSIAFLTSRAFQAAADSSGQELVTIFVPTTPNPTSGFLMMIPKHEIIELDVSVDDALKMVVSLGIVVPGELKNRG